MLIDPVFFSYLVSNEKGAFPAGGEISRKKKDAFAFYTI